MLHYVIAKHCSPKQEMKKTLLCGWSMVILLFAGVLFILMRQASVVNTCGHSAENSTVTHKKKKI